MNWWHMSHVYCCHKIYSRNEDIFFYINISNDYQRMLIEDTKSCVDHDGDWRSINKSLAVMNHTSEKSKWKTWYRGIRCDREGKVNDWVQDIDHVMNIYITLSVNIHWIKKSRWRGQEEKSWYHKSKKSIVAGSRQSCLSQDHLDALKLRQRWKAAQRRIKLTRSSLFLCVLFLSWVYVIVLLRGMQHSDLDKTKVIKIQTDSMSDVRKPNFKSVLNSVLPVKPVRHIGQIG
jgi:hypothetical protein